LRQDEEAAETYENAQLSTRELVQGFISKLVAHRSRFRVGALRSIQ
jgi:hypothetical protein